jgi:hypothetical protein
MPLHPQNCAKRANSAVYEFSNAQVCPARPVIALGRNLIIAVRASVSEVTLMTSHNRWRNSYNSALHACGNKDCQERKTGLAIRACVEHLWQIDREGTTEQEEIYTALADLSILNILYRKYA